VKPETRWPLGIALLLAGFVVVNLLLMRLAGNDPSFAVEPDYYRKAVGFDSTMAQDRRSLALGWRAASALVPSTGSGWRVNVTLTDSVRQPVAGATVTVSARYNARANDIVLATLHETAPGLYSAPLAVSHGGEWEVGVDATRGAEHFVVSTRAEAASRVARAR
jgi:nitrogen fixation protein FixH